MTAAAFCAAIRRELAEHGTGDAWVRGALGLCEIYATTDRVRFGAILDVIARGSGGFALAEGARWLLPRWRTWTADH